MSLERLKSISQNTLVPLGLVAVALGTGWLWRDREAAREQAISEKFAAQIAKEVAAARDAILGQLEANSERYAFIQQRRDAEIEQTFQVTFELNPTLTRPQKYR